jgi:thymidylate synthase ThyX
MQTSAKVVLDSISPAGARITTLQLVYPRLIHAEAKTHRVIHIGDDAYELLEETGFMDCVDLSRNASSSRAIPVSKIIEQVRNNPAMPIHWSKNQPGMQAQEEVTDKAKAEQLWRGAALEAARFAEDMANIGLHKQVANRVLEPFQWMHVVVTATEWDNFFKLRLHSAADPNIYELARVMKEAMDASVPVERELHIPYVDDMVVGLDMIDDICLVSAARCARVSYLNHDGSKPDIEKDLVLARMLRDSGHASPFEHIARPGNKAQPYANFVGWESFRHHIDL